MEESLEGHRCEEHCRFHIGGGIDFFYCGLCGETLQVGGHTYTPTKWWWGLRVAIREVWQVLRRFPTTGWIDDIRNHREGLYRYEVRGTER